MTDQNVPPNQPCPPHTGQSKPALGRAQAPNSTTETNPQARLTRGEFRLLVSVDMLADEPEDIVA